MIIDITTKIQKCKNATIVKLIPRVYWPHISEPGSWCMWYSRASDRLSISSCFRSINTFTPLTRIPFHSHWGMMDINCRRTKYVNHSETDSSIFLAVGCYGMVIFCVVNCIKGKSHIALNPSRRCLTCGAKWTFCRTGPKNVWMF